MITAEEKRKDNIAEYIIHMYQSEDLIRIYHFDMDHIREYVISHMTKDEAERDKLLDWYRKLAEEMKAEGIEENGRLSKTQSLINDLQVLANDLLENDDSFIAIYSKAKPHIAEMLEEAPEISPVQLCINAIYGLLIARINGREIPEEVEKALPPMGKVLGYLSGEFKDREEN